MTSEFSIPIPQAGASGRYAVLHHSGIDSPHYDLLIEIANAPKLLTWRSAVPPESWNAATPFERIADHRLMYMVYEGDISGGRGSVKRVAQGATTFTSGTSAASVRVRLSGDLQVELSLPAQPFVAPHPCASP